MTRGVDWRGDVSQGEEVAVVLPRRALEVLAGFEPSKAAELNDAQALLRAALEVA
ncbi:MAG TPA: hypothetical protein VFA43_26625 [Gemmatimonadaceae bacterium]|nr:hypothetical protein [Gemmatimonadaceae bacterium]